MKIFRFSKSERRIKCKKIKNAIVCPYCGIVRKVLKNFNVIRIKIRVKCGFCEKYFLAEGGILNKDYYELSRESLEFKSNFSLLFSSYKK